MSGYQYVPIESVEPNEDVSLEGFTSCNVGGCSMMAANWLTCVNVDLDDPHDGVLQVAGLPREGESERRFLEFASALPGRPRGHPRQHGL